MEDLWNSPILLLVIGYVLARWDKRGDQQSNQATLATEINTRLLAAEAWIKQHSEIRVDFQALASGLETVTKAIDKLTERFDEWSPQTKRARA